MSLTYWDANKARGGGNYGPTTLYYEEDRKIVLDQPGAKTYGLINYEFDPQGIIIEEKHKNITVFAAKDADNNVLPYLALPCPPYYHNEIPQARPKEFLNSKS